MADATKRFFKRSFHKIVIVALVLNVTAYAQIQPLNDEELSQQTGQAAFYTDYIAPPGSGTGSGATTGDFGFYTLGLNGQVELNTNISRVQLGCGGVKGPGCDIDINNLSLSGNPGTGSCPSGGSNVANCDAVLRNPFMRLAIKNPDSLARRQVVGLQLGAQNVTGLLQTGTNTAAANGINSISGYMKVQSTSAANTLTGTISTAPAYVPVYNPAPATGPGAGTNNQPGSPYYTIQGTLTALGGIAATTTFMMNSGGFYIPGFSGINFSVPGYLINRSRVSEITVNPTANLPDVIVGYTPDDGGCGFLGLGNCNGYGTPVNNPTFQPGTGTYPTGAVTGTQGGPVSAITTSCNSFLGIGCALLPNNGVGVQVDTHLYGKVSNVSSQVAFTQPLGFIHSIPINSPLSLSLQSQDISWPGAASDDVAKQGWWMSMKDPVYVGNLTPSAPINLCPDASSASSCVFPQFAAQFNKYLETNTLNTDNLLGVLSRDKPLGVQFGTLLMSPIALNLNGIQLSNQNTVPNCFGGLKFC